MSEVSAAAVADKIVRTYLNPRDPAIAHFDGKDKMLAATITAALDAAEARVWEEAASLAEEGCYDVRCTAEETSMSTPTTAGEVEQGLREETGKWIARQQPDFFQLAAIWNEMQATLLPALAARVWAWLEEQPYNWRGTAEQESRNRDYYRDLVVQIGQLFGVEARTADDGGIHEDVLCAKVPELVVRLTGERERLRVFLEDKQHQIFSQAVSISTFARENERLRGALEKIAEGRGTFRLDPLEFASNVIEEAKTTARKALAPPAEGREG